MKRMREKLYFRIIILMFWYSENAHARLLSTFDRTRVVRITSRAAVGWFRWRSCIDVTKNPNNTGEIGASVYIVQKTSEISAEFQKITLRRWVYSIRVNMECLGEVA